MFFLACPAIGANAATLSLDFLRLSCTRTKKASLTASRPGTCSTRTSRSIEVRERERAQFPWRRNKLAPRATPRFLPSFLPSRPSITTLDRVEVFAFFFSFSFSLLFCADCGSNLSVPGAASGVFTSPKWPDKYDRSSGLLSCSWQVQSARDHRILLHFESFSIEGEQESEFSFFFFFFFGLVLLHLFDIDSSWMRRGRRAGLEETGRTARGNLRRKAQRRTRNFHVGRQRDESDVSRLSKYVLSLLCVKRCVLSHRFILADKVAGGRGFRAVWTEVKSGYDCDEASHFRCANNSFCIAKQLECDGNLNCGVHDDSDEAHCNYGRLFLSFTKKKKKKTFPSSFGRKLSFSSRSQRDAWTIGSHRLLLLLVSH